MRNLVRLIGLSLLLALAPLSVLAADMPLKAPPLPVAVYNWTGFYIGGNVGGGWANGDTFFNPLPTAAQFTNLLPQTLGNKPSGVIGGVQAGYNWQNGNFVIGIETDIQGADVNGTSTTSPIIQNNGTPFVGAFGPSSLSTSEKLNWLGTTRLRAGFAPVDRLLLYVTGGVAYGQVGYTAVTNFTLVQYPAAFSTTKAGWTAGVGAEWALAANWTVKAEYLYIDLGNQSTIANAVPGPSPFQVGYSWKTQEQIARVGVNYKFSGPVVAKY